MAKKTNSDLIARETNVNEAIFTGVISIAVIFLSIGFFVSKENTIYIIGLMFLPFVVGMLRIYGVILDSGKLKLVSEIAVLFIVPITLWLVPLLVMNEVSLPILKIEPQPDWTQEQILKVTLMKNVTILRINLINILYGGLAILVIIYITKRILGDYNDGKYLKH